MTKTLIRKKVLTNGTPHIKRRSMPASRVVDYQKHISLLRMLFDFGGKILYGVMLDVLDFYFSILPDIPDDDEPCE
jgi:hypothetical protein